MGETMAKLELHLSTGPYIEVDDEPVSEGPTRWAPGQVVPHVAEVTDELLTEYRAAMGLFWKVQDKLRRLYDEGTPADAVRPSNSS
jgi:hypothetical protein